MTSYFYRGVRTSLNIAGQDVLLCPGAAVELPEDSPYVQRLLREGKLETAAAHQEQTDAAKSASKKSKGGKR